MTSKARDLSKFPNEIPYDNNASGLTATDVQAATDETNSRFASLSGRNVIINGDGRINQRGYTSGTATSGAGEYTLDRWKVVTSGQNLTFTGDDSRRVMTAPAGGVEQVIEDKNIVGGTYVINWDGTATATVNGSAVTKGSTFTLTANTNATLRMIDGTFSDVQIETGSVATPFERRPFGAELALCQRYAFLLAPEKANATVSGVFGFDSTRAFDGSISAFPTTMRAEPTVTLSGTWNLVDGFNSATPGSNLTFNSIGTYGYSGHISSGGSGIVASQYYAVRTFSTTSKALFSAEL